MKNIYVAAYHQSKFGKLFDLSVPAIVERAVTGACGEIAIDPSQIDVGSIAAACNFTLNEQGLLAGLLASVPGLESKPIESVENACASGGQAVLSVVHKLQLGLGEVGIAVGYEKMRDAAGKMDGKLVGKVLGYFSHPDEREGKVFVFPHLFAEVMASYIAEYGATARDLAAIAVTEYRNARFNPFAQMRDVELTVDVAEKLEGVNRCIVDGLPLKTYDCSQITDGYASIILATADGLARLGLRPSACVRLAGWAQATDPLKKAGRDVLRPAGAYRAMRSAYDMAGVKPAEINVAELHDCFTVMGAIGTEVIGKAEPGGGARYWVEGCAEVTGACGINTSGGLIAKGHPIGATGIAMIGWSAWQLAGKAPKELQVARPRYAATFNIGGPICASVCTVLAPPA
jgi:acetyl-CoA acetyltransferase